ncbi:MAG: HAD-IIIA family hydrolase [Deltaproteobacteria bacterium]|nr:HAD-IIIA family hydrolase [Deltaproteobacteria bacterium]
MARGLILDRDGTLVDFVRDPELGSVSPAFHPDHLRLLPGVVDGLRAFAAAGYLLAIATNQPDAAKGRIPVRAIARTNQALVALLGRHGIAIAGIECCLHHPEGGPGGDPALVRTCDGRKPGPGMLLRLVARLGLDPAASWLVGDTENDLGAARAAGLRCALVVPVRRCDICPLANRPPGAGAPDLVASRLDELAGVLLAEPPAPC